jgi:hypothetical protein
MCCAGGTAKSNSKIEKASSLSNQRRTLLEEWPKAIAYVKGKGFRSAICNLYVAKEDSIRGPAKMMMEAEVENSAGNATNRYPPVVSNVQQEQISYQL